MLQSRNLPVALLLLVIGPGDARATPGAPADPPVTPTVPAKPTTTPTNPQDRLERAKRAYQQAERQFSLGEFEQALLLYKQAFALKDLPGFLFNIGQCHFNLGRYSKALFFYDRYLSRSPNAPNRPIVEQLIERAKSEVAREEAAKQTPTPTALSPTAAATQRAAADGSGANQRGDGKLATRTLILWSGVGLSAALALSGAITGALVLDRRAEYLSDDTPLQRQREAADSGRALRTTTNVLFGVAAAVAVGTGLYYLFSDNDEADGPVVGAGATPGGAVLALGSSF